MDTDLLDAIAHAQRHIAPKAYPVHHLHGDRWLYGFEDYPYLYVVADSRVTQLGLAILIIEAGAVARAIQVGAETQAVLEPFRLRDLPPPTETRQ